MAIKVDIADGDLCVGFQLLQKLPEASEICLGGCFYHAAIVSRPLAYEKELSTPKRGRVRFLHKVDATRNLARPILTPLVFPGKFDWEQWAAPSPALALAVTFAFVSQFKATALSIFLHATGHSPLAIGAAFGPAGRRSPDSSRTLAVRKGQIWVVRIVAP